MALSSYMHIPDVADQAAELVRLRAENERLIEVVKFVAGYDPQFPFPASLAISKARAALAAGGKKETE